MPNILKVLRSLTAGNRPTSEYGAPYVNFADKQFGVVDNAAVAQDLIGVPFFSTAASYAAGQAVNYQGQIYIALTAMAPAAWNAANWSPVVSKSSALLGALAYNGMQINGSFDVIQDWANATGNFVTTTGQYACDHWALSKNGTMAASLGVMPMSNALATPMANTGFRNVLCGQVATAQASLGASDYVVSFTNIEGYRSARLNWGAANAQPLTICFWSAHNRTGTYSISVRNSANTRTYAATYVQAVSDTAQFNVITVPGDTSGTWLNDTGVGISITFCHGCGTTFTAPTANIWSSGNYLAAPGQVNAVASTADKFRIAGFLAVPGSDAPLSTNLYNIMRPFDQELLLCQRYYEKGIEDQYYMGGLATGITAVYWTIKYLVQKRIAPTVTPANWSYWSGGGNANCSITIQNSYIDKFNYSVASTTAWNGFTLQGTWTASARY